MIAQEPDRPIIVSKVKYLGSCLLPSPIELEATIMLYYNIVCIKINSYFSYTYQTPTAGDDDDNKRS